MAAPPPPSLEKLRPLSITRDTTTTTDREGYNVIISDINGIRGLSGWGNLKASQITEERKTWATYTDMSLFGLKRTRCAES